MVRVTYGLFMIAKNNVKRQKGDMITFMIMSVIVSLLIFMSVSLLMGIGSVYENRYQEVNGADLIVTVLDSEETRDCLQKTIEIIGCKDYEATKILRIHAEHKNQKDAEFQNGEFIVESAESQPRIMKVVPKETSLEKNEILMPFNMKNEYAIGDVFQLKIGEEIYDLRVAGFAENHFFCSTLSIDDRYLYVSGEAYDMLAESESKSLIRQMLYKVIYDKEGGQRDFDDLELRTTQEYARRIAPHREANPGADYDITLCANWGLIKWGNGMLPSVVSAILLAFAVLMFTISLIVISFSINNFIQRNVKNTGILEASGYTVREIRLALTLQIMTVACIGTFLGLLAGVIIMPSLGDVFGMMLGISWKRSLNPLAAIITAAALLGVVYVTVSLLGRKYQKITVLDALRGGIHTHNFKKNYFSFEDTPLPIPVVLSLKDAAGGIGKNVAMTLITTALVISCLLGFGLVENFGLKPEGTISSMGVDLGDMAVTGKNGHGDELRSLSGVRNVLSSISFKPTIEFKGKELRCLTLAQDDQKYALKLVMLKGREPKTENEILLTFAAAEQIGADVGDVVTIKYGEQEEDYLVTGLNQRMMNAGKTITMTMEGAERLGVSVEYCDYYVTAKEGISYDDLKGTVQEYEKEQGLEFEYSDTQKVVQGTVQGISSAMAAICGIFVTLTVLIIIFVEALVIRAKITREWRGMGISKALGMRSRDLISQIAMTNFPAVFVGCIVGAIFAEQAGKGLIKTIFQYMGLQKVEFAISFHWFLIVIIGITAVAIFTSAIAGFRVKKLIPVEMITEE